MLYYYGTIQKYGDYYAQEIFDDPNIKEYFKKMIVITKSPQI